MNVQTKPDKPDWADKLDKLITLVVQGRLVEPVKFNGLVGAYVPSSNEWGWEEEVLGKMSR